MGYGYLSKMLPAAFLAIFCIVCSLTHAQEESSDEREFNTLHQLSRNYYYLTNVIYRSRSQEEGNILFSPFNIQSLDEYCVIREENPSQVARELKPPVKTASQNIITSLEDDGNITFTYACDGKRSNFSSNDNAEIAHTSFVSVEHFGNLINFTATTKEPHSEGDISPISVMVFKNSFNFTAEWTTKFDTSNTKSEKFFVTPTETKEVQMMHLTSDGFHFLDSQELGCKMIELPYKGDKLSLVVLLPNELDGLANLESKLHNVELHHLLNRTDTHNVSVSLPKFKIEHSKISMSYVTKTVERAVFGVNEDGTVGAPATVAVRANERGNDSQSAVPEVFRADHPFMFILLEKRAHIIFFIGRVTSPDSSSEEHAVNISLPANTTN